MKSLALLYILSGRGAAALQPVSTRRNLSSELMVSSVQSIGSQTAPNASTRPGTNQGKGKVGTLYRDLEEVSEADEKPRLSKTIPSGQKQLPWHTRIAKVSEKGNRPLK